MRKIIFFLVGLLALAFLSPSCRQMSSKADGDDTTTVVRVNNARFFHTVKGYLQEGYAVKMVPAGNSMLPTIRDNTDVVVLQRADSLLMGDIVLSEIEKDHYVMHRIVNFKDEELTLKGDNNKTTERTKKKDVVAKVVLIIKDGAKEDDGEKRDVDTLPAYQRTPWLRLDTIKQAAIMVDTLQRLVDMQHVLTFNETACELWEKVGSRKTFVFDDLVSSIVDTYDIDRQTAKADCEQLLLMWLRSGLVRKVTRP